MDDQNLNADFDKLSERVSLKQLADQGVEALLAGLGNRVLPDAVGQVGVAAFNSSI
jgi:hypothetical protein